MERHVAPRALTTARLRGESTRAEHFAGLCRLLGDERVGATLGGARTPAEVADTIERLAGDWAREGFGLYSFFLGEELVARGGIRPTLVEGEPVVEVGWTVHPDHWNQGLATEIGAAGLELAAELEIPEVVSFTLPHNAASRRVMEKLGLTYVRDIVYADLPHVLYASSVSSGA